MDGTEILEATSGRPSKRQRTSQSGPAVLNPLQCQVCYRVYERADHLNRHLDSHRNERSFRCGRCPATFNRKDLLLRHQAIHAKNASSEGSSPSRATERAAKACDVCVLSKVKCDNSRPCQRCRKKGLECTTNAPRSRSTYLHRSATIEPPISQDIHLGQIEVEMNENSYSPRRDPVHELNPVVQELLELCEVTQNQEQQYPAFFEQIMLPDPDFLVAEYTQPPPQDLANWLPEVEWLGPLDLFDSNFTPTIDNIFEAQTYNFNNDQPSDRSGNRGPGKPKEAHDTSSIGGHSSTIQHSPGIRDTEQNHPRLREDEGIILDEHNIDFATSPHKPYSSDVDIPDTLSSQTRDKIFQLVSRTARNQVTVLSFPSPSCLDKLIKTGIAKRLETDAWIHPYTFISENSRPEYLTALIAAGCVCFGIPAVSRTGLVLQDITRIALNSLAELDNAAIHDLQYLQASMLWLDIGAFCGYTKKMEIAESSLQSLVTTLRHDGRFDSVQYRSIIPNIHDNEEDLDVKWREFVEQESYKRLVYHLMEHDYDMTMVKHRQPLISYAELTLPLPASELLWLAPSAEIWRTRFLTGDHGASIPSLRMLLQHESGILQLSLGIDRQLARSIYIHGLSAQIWEHSQQSVLLQNSSEPSSQMWSRSRQRTLYHSLQHADFSLDNSPASACVFHQFLQMYLHVNLETVIRFIGRWGEDEAHRAYTQLQSWSSTKEARIAVCHAGQVMRAARAITPYQNRGVDSFAVYHSILVLWAYSMMSQDRAKIDGTSTNQASSPPSIPVLLDVVPSSNQDHIDAFVLMSHGSPCLHMTAPSSKISPVVTAQEFCNLSYPSQVMRLGVNLLDAYHPGVDRETAPPLLKALCAVMEELGGLN